MPYTIVGILEKLEQVCLTASGRIQGSGLETFLVISFCGFQWPCLFPHLTVISVWPPGLCVHTHTLSPS